jgi:hypothetical protein
MNWDIERNAKRFAPEGEDEKLWIARKKAELRSYQDAIDAAAECTPRSQAYDKWNDLNDVY